MPCRATFWGRKLAERSPFPARTPIVAADGRASLPFSRWILREFDALAEIRTTVLTGGVPVPAATYSQAMGSVAIPAAAYTASASAPIFAAYAEDDPLSVGPAAYPGADAILLPFGEY